MWKTILLGARWYRFDKLLRTLFFFYSVEIPTRPSQYHLSEQMETILPVGYIKKSVMMKMFINVDVCIEVCYCYYRPEMAEMWRRSDTCGHICSQPLLPCSEHTGGMYSNKTCFWSPGSTSLSETSLYSWLQQLVLQAAIHRHLILNGSATAPIYPVLQACLANSSSRLSTSWQDFRNSKSNLVKNMSWTNQYGNPFTHLACLPSWFLRYHKWCDQTSQSREEEMQCWLPLTSRLSLKWGWSIVVFPEVSKLVFKCVGRHCCLHFFTFNKFHWNLPFGRFIWIG